jgi:Tol biopolymer transport system component
MIPGTGTLDSEGAPSLSPDELTLYFDGKQGAGAVDLYVAQRATTSDPFGAPSLLSTVNSSSDDSNPSISSDGLTLVFASNRSGPEHMYVSTRSSTLGQFAAASELANVNTTNNNDSQPFLTADGQELWFSSDRPGGLGMVDIYRATKSGSSFANPMPVSELNSSSTEWFPVRSADGLTVYFASYRTGTGVQGGQDIWTSHRSTTGDGFPAPTVLGVVNGTTDETPAWISADDCRLYLASDRSGTGRVYVATRAP